MTHLPPRLSPLLLLGAAGVLLAGCSFELANVRENRAAPGTNVISEIKIHDDFVEILGSQTPAFVFWMMPDSRRVVIDFPHATLAGVPRDIESGNPLLARIHTSVYDHDSLGPTVVRVILYFKRTPEYDAEVISETVRVKFRAPSDIGSRR